MPAFHDPIVHDRLRARLEALTPDAPRQWGQMSVDQMLWHVNESLRSALGQAQHKPKKPPPIPRAMFRFIVLNLPWPKGAPTHPECVAGRRYNFSEEKAQALQLIDAFASRSIDGPWADSPVFGPVKGRFVSRLQAKHLDHHLRQFGA